MTNAWINFKNVKKLADFEKVLAHYNIELQGTGDQRSALCPFHDEERPSFKANLRKGIYHCFGCDAKGNVLDFVSNIEDCSLRDAAKRVGECCGFEVMTKPPSKGAEKPAEEPAKKSGTKPRHTPENGAEEALSEPNSEPEGNKPLTFTLKLEAEHPYLFDRVPNPKTVEYFGLGFCNRGMMKERIAIPIHDGDGNLVAYTGRWAAHEVPKGTDKYMLPPNFKKLSVLYNLHRVAGEEFVVGVEGYFSVYRLYELGIPAVSFMGHVLSEEHLDLLTLSKVGRFLLMLDGDKPGRKATAEVLPRIAERFFVRDAHLPDGAQPDTVDEKLLKQLFGIIS